MGKSARQLAEERRRREAELCAKMLAAAEEGNVEAVEELLGQGLSPECQDPGEYSPLSEAANQGNLEVVQLLLQREADPNSLGEYKRTPLWRAAFNDHTEVCRRLLRAGADPRVACQNQTPAEVCSAATRQAVFEGWDITETEQLQIRCEATQEARRVQEQHTRLMEESVQTSLNAVVDLDRQRRDAVRLLEQCRETYNRYAAEYDHMCSPAYTGTVTQAMLDAALVAVSGAEQRFRAMEESVRFIESRITEARGVQRQTRPRDVVVRWGPGAHTRCGPGFQRVVFCLLAINWRQQQIAESGLHSHWIWMPDDLLFALIGFLPHVRVDLQIGLEEVEEVVIHDADKELGKACHWPLLVDTTGRAGTFLRYRNTVFLDAFQPQRLDPEAVRHALLGSLQFGRCVVVSLGDLDVLLGLEAAFDAVCRGLLSWVMDKSILNPTVLSRLIRQEDGDLYPLASFTPDMLRGFRFVLVTTCRRPCLAVQDCVFVIAVTDRPRGPPRP